MLFNSLIYLLFSSSVTLRRDISIHFNRIAILALQYSIILHITSLFMCNKGISLHGGLLHISNITQIFQTRGPDPDRGRAINNLLTPPPPLFIQSKNIHE